MSPLLKEKKKKAAAALTFANGSTWIEGDWFVDVVKLELPVAPTAKAMEGKKFSVTLA